MWLCSGATKRVKRRPSCNGGLLFSVTDIDRDTVQAYLETDYRVHGNTPATLKVGESCPTLASLHETHHVKCSAFITACNPFSQPYGDTANAERQTALARELEQRGLYRIEGTGQHPTNKWPGEASFLVLGLPLEEAKTLGTRLKQNAIIWSDFDSVPQLILLR